MKTDRETAEVVRSWMKEPVELNDAGLHRVLAQVPDTPQRRYRWLWPFKWRPFAPSATRSADVREVAPTGRSLNMLNATRVAALAAVLALGGTLVFVSGPFGPPEPAVVPGAEAPADPMAAAHFTGTVVVTREKDRTVTTLGDRFKETWIAVWRNAMTDPRVSGDGETLDYLETIAGDGRSFISHSAAGRLTNDEGSFALECTGGGDVEMAMNGVIACWYTGEAGYEGLTAFVVLTSTDAGFDAEGWIFPGDPPPPLDYEA